MILSANLILTIDLFRHSHRVRVFSQLARKPNMKHQRQEEVAVNESLFVRIIQMANQRKGYFTIFGALVTFISTNITYTLNIVHPIKAKTLKSTVEI